MSIFGLCPAGGGTVCTCTVNICYGTMHEREGGRAKLRPRRRLMASNGAARAGGALAKLPCRRGHRSDPLVVGELRGSADGGEVIFEIRWLAPAVFQI